MTFILPAFQFFVDNTYLSWILLLSILFLLIKGIVRI